MDEIVGSLNIVKEHYLNIEQLKDNYIYEVKGENFSVAVWKEKKKRFNIFAFPIWNSN